MKKDKKNKYHLPPQLSEGGKSIVISHYFDYVSPSEFWLLGQTHLDMTKVLLN